MRILAIDTSCGAASVAVVEGGRAEPLVVMIRPMTRGHAEALAPMVEEAMRGIDGGFPSLTRIAVATGPGSFTGIRVGLAMTRAMGVGLAIPVVGVSTLAAFAAPLLSEPRTGIIAAAIDARHGSVYFQLFEPPAARWGRLVATAPASACARSAPGLPGSRATRPRWWPAKRSGPGCLTTSTPREPRRTSSHSRWMGLAVDPARVPRGPVYVKPPDARPNATEPIARAPA